MVSSSNLPTLRAPNTRLQSLDAVRGLAALAVMVSHTFEAAGLLPAIFDPHKSPIILGVSGVVAFFLVSGFVIPLSFERHKSQSRFWVGRFFRIFPMYILAFGIAVFLLGRDADTRTIIAHLFLLQDYVPGVDNLVPNSWTLSIEWVWYLFFAAVIALGINRNSPLLTLLMVGALLTGTLITVFIERVPMGRIGLLATCLMGFLVFRVHMEDERWKNMTLAVILFAFIFLGLASAFLFSPPSKPGVNFSFMQVLVTWGAGYGLFLIGLFTPIFVSGNRILALLGQISYSVYLLHSFAIEISIRFFGAGWWIPLLVFGVTIPVSALTYRYIEKPCNTIGSTIAKRIASRKLTLR